MINESLRYIFDKTVKDCGGRTALYFKRGPQWKALTYDQLGDRVRCVTEIISRAGIKPGDKVALHLENSPEWVEIYLGITCMGATTVPVDPKLKEQEISHILRDSQSKALFTHNRNKFFIRDMSPTLPDLTYTLLVDGDGELPKESEVIRFDNYDTALASMLNETLQEPAYDRLIPGEDDIASIIYTSGTTGRPKGAMLTHKNFVSDVSCCLAMMTDLREDDNFLVVLPLHHAFAFTTCLVIPIYMGAQMSFVQSLRTVAEDFSVTRPTVLLAVPLLLEKMYKKIKTGADANKFARFLMNVGLSKVVGRGIVKKLGGRLRIVISGGAPCDPDVIHGWSKFGIYIREGYGLTECAPVVSLNPPEKNKPGSVGKALPGIDIKILNPNDVGVGEIAISGPNLMKGYYKNEEATNEVLVDNWFHTGDLGFIDKEGFITISGRKKNLIVNREGKNIYPEEVEYQMMKCPLLAEVIVLGYREPGEKVGERVGTIVVPNLDAIEKETPGLQDDEIERRVRAGVKAACNSLSEYKRPRRIQVRFVEFEKTSTQKVKRYLYAIDTSKMD